MTTWDVRKTIGAVAVAAAIAGVGGAAIAAAADGGHTMMQGGPFGPGGPPPGAPITRHIQAASQSLHGEYVIADGRGGFATMITQTGLVTAISPTSVTARSADGFSQTYVIRGPDATDGHTFAIGDDVTVDATKEGEAAVVSTMRPPPPSGR